MARDFCYREVVPFSAMVAMEFTDVGLKTVFKEASIKGMSYHVFLFYAYALAALLLLPSPLISLRSSVCPPLTPSVMYKIGLLGFIGGVSQMIGYKGIDFSSPMLASAIANLSPAFTFILAIIFRMEKVSLKRTSSRAKILGTIVSVAGAFVVTFCKGPAILRSPPSTTHSPRYSADSTWILGGTLLTADYLLTSLWYILQEQIMREYPNEVTVIFFYNVCVSFMAAISGFLTLGFSSAWRLRMDTALASIVCSGVFGLCISNSACSWVLRVKGAVYVSMFRPVAIVIAAAMGVLLLHESLYLGSVVGGTIISLGFYTVMWGIHKEDMVMVMVMVEGYEGCDEAPLLQSRSTATTPNV